MSINPHLDLQPWQQIQVWFVVMVGDLNVDYWLVCRSRFGLIDTYGETHCESINTFADPSIMSILEVLAFFEGEGKFKIFFLPNQKILLYHTL